MGSLFSKLVRPAFYYGGQDFASMNWEVEQTNVSETDFIRIYTAPDRTVALRITIKVIPEFQVIQWLPEFIGLSDKGSKIISNFRSLALDYPLQDCCEVTVRRTYGSKNRADDFSSQKIILGQAGRPCRLEMSTDEGRSSAAWLPFLGVDLSENKGFNIGIGWSGAWNADVTINSDTLLISAGMVNSCFYVKKGEIIRQPSIFIHERTISIAEGQNQYRQFILNYHSPRNSAGELFKVPISCLQWGGMTSQMLLQNIDDIIHNQLPFDCFWVDAGWYGPDRLVDDCEMGPNSDWETTVGNWRINQTIHPQKFKIISAAAHAGKMKFLLWFEIERVCADTPLFDEHPEWLLSGKDPKVKLLNLGDPDACNWAIKTVSDLIESEKIDYYRQDFNINVFDYWELADSESRKGITEAKYIAGLYRFWDTLRMRFPDLLIDNCASGGRRIDFETMSRSLCLWRVDGFRTPEMNQKIVRNLTEWVPLHAGTVNLTPGDKYAFLSGVSAGVSWASCLCRYAYQPTAGVNWYSSPDKESFSWSFARTMLNIAIRMREYFTGNYYVITKDEDTWSSYQFDRPARNDGFFIVFRSENSLLNRLMLNLYGIDPKANYILEKEEETCRISGKKLQHFIVRLQKKRSCAVYFYSMIK